MQIFNKKVKEIFTKLPKILFPLNRSLTGKGNLQTLLYIKKYVHNLNIIKFKTGKKIYDWKIPYEWGVKNAYILHVKTNKKFAEFKKNNLHLVSYSEPKSEIISKKKLLKKINTIKLKPNLIPYVTSYYKRDWGFCLKHNDINKLPNGDYKVVIDSFFKKGNLILGESIIKGKSKKEFFFSTNICHPSMANNELSGILMCTALANFIKNKKNTRYTYRIIFVPETIGSLAYIHKNLKLLKKNVIGGLVVSCVGDNKSYSHIESPEGNNFSDKMLEVALKNKKNHKRYGFLNRGSDERQYCSPKVNLPICGLSRTKYHEYFEYHTSGDNLNTLSLKGMNETFKTLSEMIDIIEYGLYPQSKNYGEPHLSKYGLYRTLATESIKKDTKNLLNFIAYANGNLSSFEIAIKCSIDLTTTLKIIRILKDNKLIFFKDK